MQRQLELHIVCYEWEEILTEGGGEHVQSALREMFRAYFREVLSEERSATDGGREDTGQS
jgi:hypothetical protein